MAFLNAGGLWRKTDKNGREYFSGKFEINNQVHRVVLMFNDRKKNDKEPDLRVSLIVDDNMAEADKIMREREQQPAVSLKDHKEANPIDASDVPF